MQPTRASPKLEHDGEGTHAAAAGRLAAAWRLGQLAGDTGHASDSLQPSLQASYPLVLMMAGATKRNHKRRHMTHISARHLRGPAGLLPPV